VGSAFLVVDTHVHLWPHGLVHPNQTTADPLDAAPSDYLTAALDAGVDVGVISPASVYRENAYILGAAAATPGRMRAVVTVDPLEDEEVERLASHAQAGAIGARIAPGPHIDRLIADPARLDAVLDAAADLGLVLQWTIRTQALDLIRYAAARRPVVSQVLDHLGLPDDPTDLAALDRVCNVAEVPDLAVKLSGMYAYSRTAYPYADTWRWAEGVLEAFGSGRVMWASDWPLSGESAAYLAQCKLVDQLSFVDAAARRDILSSTAIRVWGIAERGPASAGSEPR
jgi:predicted TIM-barrel fold metal-dependent hydrolase